jgi:hypothetical protein
MHFSYVITFRSDLGMRLTNLRAVLRWLSQIQDMEVVLVEQDRAPTITIDTIPPNCNHCFVYNAGPFNKSWGLNVGFNRSSGAIIGFGDADLVTNAATLMSCYQRCDSEFEAMKPYDRLIDLTLEESRSVLQGNWNIHIDRTEQPRNREGIREYVSYCGGLFLLRRDLFEELGGFDERFLGWGGEDDAMTVKLYRLVKRRGVQRNQTAYHLWHERSRASCFSHPHYQQNRARTKWYISSDTRSLALLCQQDRLIMGRLDKYGNNKL